MELLMIDIPKIAFFTAAVISAAFVFLIFGFIFYTAAPVLAKEGIGFLTGTTWSYGSHQFGIATYICGTLVLTAVTLALAVPLGVLTAIFLAEWAPVWLDKPLSTMIELLVGIPSVVYGIFGFFVLEGIFRDYINPFLSTVLGFIPLFYDSNPNSGFGVLLAATILTIMILPTITSLSREAIIKVPQEFREGSIALGATKWETVKHIILPVALTGIVTAIVLGLMRAMGETMAVAMVMGGLNKIPTSIFDGGTTMTSKILADIGYRMSFDEGRSALFGIGVVLFAMEVFFVAIIRLVNARIQKWQGLRQ